ncbi:MAG TPA: amidohydrolase family protein [Flavisolibacter sp.]|nr:amidohydrolase family protein [Flavisolibacter sp.]
MSCIDTHIHIWNFERATYSWLDGNTSILNRTYLIDELAPQLAAAGVTEGVLVQAANTKEETAYMLEVAEQTSWLKGVVGWLPLEQPDEVATILSAGYAKHPLFKGVRHLIHDEPDTKWLLQPAVLQSLQLLADAGIPYDVVGVLPAHLETVLQVLNKVPALTIVLDHLNQPPIQQGERFGRWGKLITEIAAYPKAYGKISGLGTTTGTGEAWDVDDIKPYVAFAVEKFGTDRCFCGGDWPVSLLASSYAHAWSVYKQTLSSLLEEKEREKILYDNAKQFYKL